MSLVFNPFTGNLDFVGTGGGGGMIYPGAGVANSTGSSWDVSYSVSGSGTQLALTNSPTFVTPNLGIPSSLTLTNATGLPVGGISATGTPSASTYLRGDGSWATPAGSMVYPGAGIANSTGSAWGTSFSTSGTGTVVALTATPIFTGAQTWNVGTLNATGLTATQTWTGGGTYTAFSLNVTDTSSAAASNLIDVGTGGGTYVTAFQVTKAGAVRARSGTSAAPSFSFTDQPNTGFYRYGFGTIGVISNATLIGIFSTSVGYDSLNYPISLSNGGPLRFGAGGTVDTYITRGGNANTLQLGNNDVSATNADAQTLRVQSTTLAATTAPDFFIQGSRGTTSGGSIVFQTAATNTQANVLKLNPNKTVNFYGTLDTSAVNLATDTTTGTKIGTATAQKLGFWNATPIVQPTTGGAAATVAATGTGDVVAASTTFDGYTIPQIVKALRNAGLLQ